VISLGAQMTSLFLFEFMDLAWLPSTLRATIHDVLECCLGTPPRRYYEWVAREILNMAEDGSVHTVVELGAGTAPITRELVKHLSLRNGISLRVSDLYPNSALYQALEEEYPDLIQTERQSVDFSRPMNFPTGSLLVLSGTFHHVPPAARLRVLKALSAYRVAIFEPLRCNPASFSLSLLGFFPGLATPLRFWNQRPGNWRRVLWCWLVPLAPVMIVWDGLVSCLRYWTEKEWREHLALVIAADRRVLTKSKLFDQLIAW
jgi:hypothetical protein